MFCVHTYKKIIFQRSQLRNMFILAKTEIGNVFPREQIWGCIFFLQLWVETVNVFIHCILNIFYQQYCILIHNQETKYLKKNSSLLTLRVTLNNWLVYHLGTARRGSWKTVKGFLETLKKYISDSPIWLRICCKFISSIAFFVNKDISWKPLGQPWCPQVTKCLCLYFQWQRSIPISE